MCDVGEFPVATDYDNDVIGETPGPMQRGVQIYQLIESEKLLAGLAEDAYQPLHEHVAGELG
eukprot:COSAG01_NODE_9665_length_2375_cov_11.442443_2_plen_62_part_00